MRPRYSYSPGRNRVAMSAEAVRHRDAFIGEHGDLEPQSCHACDARDFEPVSEIDRYGFYYPTGVCRACGCIQQTAYYRPEVLTAFYRDRYRRIYGNDPPEALWAKQVQRGGAVADFCEGSGRMSVLEIGAGAGGILQVFAERGHEVRGLDFDRRFLEYGRAQGLRLEEGGLEALEPGTAFDLVVLSHVLEHVTDPAGFLSDIRGRLKPGGRIYVEVPSVEMVANGRNGYEADLLRYFQNAHTIHFTEPSLRRIARRGGLGVAAFDPFIRCLLAPGPEPEPAEGYDHAMALLRHAERMRPLRAAQNMAHRAALRGLDITGLRQPLRRLLGR